ncbi:hypothetical protein TIFTF001_007201 [Ficus carica]|uniref:Uncharacterized protein n=1 Tax=Ficus carica TaxID=3494 RepID=A0AA88ACW5_FICCA|nr:hypothetical protein TIFTF001_007201 [Ficus carica]
MEVVEMERSDGGGSVKKTKVGNEDTYEWVVENGSVGGHSTSEICNSGSMNLQLRSIEALNPPKRPSLHAQQHRSGSNRRPCCITPTSNVVKENLHFSYLEDKLGKNASAIFYHIAQQLDPTTTTFMNVYNTIEYIGNKALSPFNYHKKCVEILSFPGKAKLSTGIGLQGHFGPTQPNIGYMRSSLGIFRYNGISNMALQK